MRFYPLKVYCYVSLISSLQVMLMQTGFDNVNLHRHKNLYQVYQMFMMDQFGDFFMR